MIQKAATCNTHCRDTCVHYGQKFYTIGGNQPTLGQCVEACGCDSEILLQNATDTLIPEATQAQINLMSDILSHPNTIL